MLPTTRKSDPGNVPHTPAPAVPNETLQTEPLEEVGKLTEILERLGRSVTGADGARPEVTAVHLTRRLVLRVLGP